MAAALECWSGRPSTDDDNSEQVLMSNPHRSDLTTSPSTSTSNSNPNPNPPKKWQRLIQTLSSFKTSILDSNKPSDSPTATTQWGTLIRNLTHLYPGSQLPEKLISDLRRHFDSLPTSYSLASFPIKDVLLHLKLIDQCSSSTTDHLAVHLQEEEEAQLLRITFACDCSLSVPAVSNLLNGCCRSVQLFEKKGATLGVVVMAVEGEVEKEMEMEMIKGRVESALRSAMKKPGKNGGGKKIPFGFCGCQEQDEDNGLMRSDQKQLIGVDELQTVRTGSDEIERWMLGSKEVEFGEQMGLSSFKGVCKGKKVWIKKMKGCERGSAYEVEIRHDLVQLMTCGHKNLVQFVGICVDEWHGLCVVTRMVDGGSVRDLIEKKKKKVEGKEVVRIALDVAEGLMFMNGHGVAYRDLNVSRILLDKQGNALLGDMGIVASCNNGGEVTEYETAGYRWLAPEVSDTL